MVELLLNVIDPLPSDSQQFGGLWGNRINDILKSGQDFSTDEDLNIGTEFKFHSGGISIYENDPIVNSDRANAHRVQIRVENITTGALLQTLTIRAPTVDNDYFLTELGQANDIQNKIFGTNIQFTEDVDFNGSEILDAVINGSNVTITNIPNSALSENIVLNNQANTFGDFNQIFRSGKLQIRNPANTFSYIITGSAITADRMITIPIISIPSNFVIDSITNTFLSRQIIQTTDLDPLRLYRKVNTSGSNVIVHYLDNANNIQTQFGSAGVRSDDVTTGLEIGSYRISLIELGTTNVEMLKIQQSKYWFGRSTSPRVVFDISNLSAGDKNLTFPNWSGEVKLTSNAIIQWKEGWCEFIDVNSLFGEVLLSPLQFYYSTIASTQNLQGTGVSFATGTTPNTGVGFATILSNGITRRSWNPYAWYRLSLPALSSADSRFFFGFTNKNGLIPSSDSPLANNESGVLIGYRSFDTEMKVFYNDGAGGTLTVVPISPSVPVPAATTTYSFEIKMTSAGILCSVYNSGVTLLGSVLLTSGALPTTTTNLNFQGLLYNPTGSNKSITPTKLYLRSEK